MMGQYSKNIFRDKTGGIVTNTIYGVGALVIGVIIILVITSTLWNANLFASSRLTATAINQSMTIDDRSGGQAFGNYTLPGATCSLTLMINGSGANETILSTNYTLSGLGGCYVASADANINATAVSITSSTTYYDSEEDTVDITRTNFSSGIQNVGNKIPTILLIVAVVFLFGALVLLLKNAREMGIGDKSSL